ncbi:MAG: sigma-54 dependent transcriptional regulator [Pseudomonadota bacterium]
MTLDPRRRILIVDDEENMRVVLDNILSRSGYLVKKASDGNEGLVQLERDVFDAILCDVRMPGMDGLAFLEEVQRRGVKTPIIMLSAYGTVDFAVDALKAGAFDYVFKPFKPDEILLTLKKVEEREDLRRENLVLRRAVAREPLFGIVGRSRVMNELLVLVERVAVVKSPVLITGESGTGKELVARAIHQAGERRDKPFIAVNCGAIPDKLLESELFGHVRGAFTDAVKARLGLFREADRGTLFLDEVGELPQAMQVKLLRALQFEEIRPVGAAGEIKVDVRIVAATARDLAGEARAGRFREDLFYRLNVLPLVVPPLRDRPEDIPPLLDHFLAVFSARLARRVPEVAPEAAEALLTYAWPGNVRELENLLDRLLVMSPGPRLESRDLPPHIRSAAPPNPGFIPRDDLDLKAGIKELEARLIREALRQSGGNRSEAARTLRISYPSLLSKIKTYGLEDC